MSEAAHQSSLFRWAQMQLNVMPELRWLMHVPNGGKRDEVTAWQLKQQGVRAGVPDILLPVARGGYHGLWIEMKNDKPRGVLSKEQKAWLDGMAAEGYAACVAYGWTEAMDALVHYLRGAR